VYTQTDPPGGSTGQGAESDIDDCLILLELSLIEVDSHFNLLSSFQCFNTGLGDRKGICHVKDFCAIHPKGPLPEQIIIIIVWLHACQFLPDDRQLSG